MDRTGLEYLNFVKELNKCGACDLNFEECSKLITHIQKEHLGDPPNNSIFLGIEFNKADFHMSSLDINIMTCQKCKVSLKNEWRLN